MKEKMTTFTAMDILGCNLYWINLNVKNINEHRKSLEKLFDRFEIEKDYYDGTDAESIIIDYVLSLRLFIKDTENVKKRVNEYLKGRGVSSNMGVNAKGVEE